VTTTVDIGQLRQAAAMLRTPTASWHREDMAAVLEAAADRGARTARKRKAKRFDPFTEDLLAKFLKVKCPSLGVRNRQGDCPVRLEHNGTIIEDVKTAAAYLKQL
jgi:hypothetical protein